LPPAFFSYHELVVPLWYAALAAAVAADRLIAVVQSRRNRRQLRSEGAQPVHDPSFFGLAFLHTAYLVAAPLEVAWFGRPVLTWLAVPALVVLIAATVLRFWAVRTLADHWNLSVVASQSLGPVTTGPYRFIRHPNYVAIVLEVAALPLVHTAWITALCATLAQIPLLARRISVEEKILMSDPAYRKQMGAKPRFFPQLAGLLLLALLVHGASLHGVTEPGANVRLHSADRSYTASTISDTRGQFKFSNLDPGWYAVSAELNQRSALTAVDVKDSADTGKLTLPEPRQPLAGVHVLTVCEALDQRNRYALAEVVIVGIFKSGMEETLRADCPNQLTTKNTGWMNAIALPPSPSSAGTAPILEQPAIRRQIDSKRAGLLASGVPGAQPRPERIVALYGRLMVPAGLASTPCGSGKCNDLTQLDVPPLTLLEVAPSRPGGSHL
jgi:methyltransferase